MGHKTQFRYLCDVFYVMSFGKKGEWERKAHTLQAQDHMACWFQRSAENAGFIFAH